MKKCSECVCYGACVILSKFINSFSEEKNELTPCGYFRPYDPREQLTAKWETDEKFPRCSHCKEHCFQQEKYCPNCGARMESVPAADAEPVRHGHWNGVVGSAFHGCDDLGDPIYRDVTVWYCSKCNRKTIIKEKFCPNCGTKMDGKDV